MASLWKPLEIAEKVEVAVPFLAQSPLLVDPNTMSQPWRLALVWISGAGETGSWFRARLEKPSEAIWTSTRCKICYIYISKHTYKIIRTNRVSLFLSIHEQVRYCFSLH